MSREDFKMDDPDIPAVRQLITHEIETCTELDLLDLIYKLLITDAIR